ncbi:hypothetical protein [Bradyrhizobium sp. USDA 4452]
MGAIGTRLSLRPLLRVAKRNAKLGQIMSRERESASSSSPLIARRDLAIQYAAASLLKHRRLWNAGSPASAGDDTECSVIVIAVLATLPVGSQPSCPANSPLPNFALTAPAMAGHSVRAVSLNGRESRRGYRRIEFCSAATAQLAPAKGAMAIGVACL